MYWGKAHQYRAAALSQLYIRSWQSGGASLRLPASLFSYRKLFGTIKYLSVKFSDNFPKTVSERQEHINIIMLRSGG